ncbi:MAG: adenylosuccinate lyase, partial [Clostridia bacterium]|nr:adenylosuccinate lyase [Clostridia bacterium]
IDLIMQDQDFAVVHDHMEEILDAKKFIGRAPSQTVEFIETEIQPILDRHSALLGEQGNVQV